jgi:hypothetical protein
MFLSRCNRTISEKSSVLLDGVNVEAEVLLPDSSLERMVERIQASKVIMLDNQ